MRTLSLIDKILETFPYDTITDAELSRLLDGTRASRYNQVKRAIENGKLLHIRRGLYHLAKRYQRRQLEPYDIAQKIYGPSYISFESALSYHDLIPEAVYTITSASINRSKQFDTPIGIFSFSKIPSQIFFTGVERVVKDHHSIFLMATPTKAIADYAYHNHKGWLNSQEMLEDLRIDEEDLKLDLSEIEHLMSNYRCHRVTHILTDLKRIFLHEHKNNTRQIKRI